MSPQKIKAVIALVAYLNRNKHDASFKLPRQIVRKSTGVETINVTGSFDGSSLDQIKVDDYSLFGELVGSSFNVAIAGEKLVVNSSGTQIQQIESSQGKTYHDFSVENTSVRFSDLDGNSYICEVSQDD